MSSEVMQIRDAAPNYVASADTQDVPQRYKRTEVGMIPKEWGVRSLGEVGQCLIGLTYNPSNVRRNGLLVLRASNIDDDGLKFGDDVFVDIDVPERIIVRVEDLLICVRNGSRPLIGKCALIDKRAAGMTFGAFMAVFRSPHNRFIAYCFESDLVKRQIHAHLGATINQITNKSLNSFQVPFPHPAEQRAIAKALSDVDGLLGALEALIDKKRSIKQAAMQQLLTGKTRLPGFSGEWAELNMASDSILKARIGWQGLTTSEYLSTGEYYLVTGTDFVNGRVEWSTCHFVSRDRFVQDRNIQLSPGDILLTKDGTIGKAGYVETLPGPATLNSGVFVMRPKNDGYIPLYMYYVLTSRIFDEFLARLQAGSTITHLYQKDFAGFAFDAPPCDEQNAISIVLSDMDAEIGALEARRDKARAIKLGMMQQLLTGRVRLVKPETIEPTAC